MLFRSAGEEVGGAGAAQAAGVDDAGQQGYAVRADWGAGVSAGVDPRLFDGEDAVFANEQTVAAGVSPSAPEFDSYGRKSMISLT